MRVRRVVTGHSADGRAVFVSDSAVEPVAPELLAGGAIHRIWGADEAPQLPNDGAEPATAEYFPPLGGFRFGLLTIAPDSRGLPADLDFEAAVADMNDRLPGMLAHMERDNPRMHTSATVDFEYVVAGRCVLELDDGERRELGEGDVVIQNGTRHSWWNPFDEPCTLVLAIVGADHRSAGSVSADDDA